MKKGSQFPRKRILALVLTCVMVLSMLPGTAFAAKADTRDTPVAEVPAASVEAAETAELPAEPLEANADLAAVGARTYYVSLKGKGGNSGLSEAEPLPGLDAVPWSQLLPGDSVLLKKGETFSGSIRMVDVHGTSDAPITIGTYGTGDAPVIEARGQGIWLQETGSTSTVGKYASSGVLLYDCSYVTVDGLNVVNRPDALKATWETTINGKSNCDTIAYSGVAVAADGVGAAEGIVLRNITVCGDSSVTAVITETSSDVSQTGVTKGAEAPVRTYTNASGTYYVSSRSGSDSNDGSSPDKAFYSLHKINELNLQPGAKVYLEYGSVFENQYLHVNGGGSEAQPVIIDAYGKVSDSRPVINTNGNGVWYQNYGTNLDNANHVRYGYVSSCINLYDVPYIEIKNIAMTNGGTYGQTTNSFQYIGEDQVDAGTVPGETGYAANGPVGSYGWGGKMCRTGVSGVAQNMGTVHHVYLQNLDIENVYGNVFIKHMNNGGVYFTVAQPTNESSTGIAKFDDMRVEGCYLKRTSRWGISAVYTGAYHAQFNGAQISDEKCRTYGQTNLYVGHNYLEEIGGDPITVMYAFQPLVEYNVSTRGAREISASVYHNGSAPNGNPGTVAAGIWPWKCKTALFEHNECFDMLNNEDGNGDGQPWDADYGDSTIYQYNYSSGNSGGCIMFCAGEAYNSVFRYNISFDDGSFGRPAGIIDMAGNAYGQIHNNTFVMKPNLRLHYRVSGPAQIENNIFYNLGDPFDPQWRQNPNVVFNNNIYAGFTTKPDHDGKAIEMEKTETLFSGEVTTGPRTPKSTDKDGTGKTASGIRSWSRDWNSDFDMFKLAGGAAKAINAGVPHSFSGLNQDASFGVAQVPIAADFYGNELDEVHDIGAFDTQTADPDPTPGSDCELISSLYELRGTNSTELQVPFTANNPTTVEAFKKGLTVSDGAEVKVLGNNDVVVADNKNVDVNMRVQITAADGTVNPTVYTIKQKNAYNSYADWVDNHQGNAWFYQYWDGSKFVNHTSWSSQWSCWSDDSKGFISVERNQACGSITTEAGSGFTFRAPVGGKVTVKYYNYKTASAPVENQIQKREAAPDTNTLIPSIRVYVNGVEDTAKAVTVNKTAAAVTTTEMTFTVDQGDTLSFMAFNAGPFTNNGGNNGVYFTPVITYADEAYTPGDDTKAPTVPGALAVTKVTQDGATLTWTASTDNRGVDHYEVSVNGGEAENVTALTKTLTGLNPGTAYTVTVKAVDEAGNKSAEAAANFTTLTAPVVDEDPPAAPTNGSVKGTPTATTAAIQWTASSSDDVAYYEITVGGATETVRNVTQITLTGLTAATEYTASVVAVDAANNKSTSALTIPFTTGAADPQAPTAPAEVEVQGITSSQATLRWTPATDNVAVTGYQVKLGENGKVVDAGNVLQYTFTGLTPATAYTAYLQAYDEAGNYSEWKQAAFTTLGSSACEVLSTLFEVRGSNADQLQVPYTASNPLTLANLAAAFEVSEGANVKVYQADGTTEVTDGNVTAGMKVKVVAQNGTINDTVYTVVQKNAYAHKADFVASQQGNVWFHQVRDAATDKLVNLTSFAGGDQGWWTGGNNACAEYNGAADDDRNVSGGNPQPQKFAGCGFVFRAPVAGVVEVSFPEQPSFRYPDKASGNSFDTFVVVYVNGVMVQGKKTQVPETGSASIDDFRLTLRQGDTVEFMVLNEGAFTSNHNANSGDVLFNPSVTYIDETFVPGPSSITLDQSELTLYTNSTETAELKRTAQLTATILPEEADQTVTWTSGDTGVVTVSATGLVTAVGNGDTYVQATAAGSLGGTVTTTCQVHVRTRMETITVKQGGAAIGSDPIKLYTNEGDDALPHTVTLTADTTPANVSHPALNWTRPDGAAGRLTITRNNDGSATLTATTDELNVGAVTVQVASAEHPDVKTTFTVHVVRMLKNPVTISGTPKFGEKLSVDLNQLSMSVIGKNALTYQWKRNGEAIQNAAAQDYTLTADDIGKAISVEVTPGADTFYEGARTAAITGTVALADNTAVPTGLSAQNCSDGSDGQITGLEADKTYEYKAEGTDEWLPVTEGATSIEGLSDGNYLVRFAQTTTHAAGTNAATVTILAAGVTGHAITAAVTPNEGGVITVASQAAKDTEVALTVAANAGYTLKADFPKVTYTDGDGTEQTVTVTDGKFIMPDADVTVTAEFEKVKLTLTHTLEHISCDQVGAHTTHEVAYGDTPTISLTADEGYTMPASITIVNAADEAFTGYRYSHTVAEPDKAAIIFTQPITENLTIRGTGDIKTYVVNYTLTNGLSAPEEHAPRQANYRELYEGTLVANPGYDLPESIIVTVGGSLIGAENFNYNRETGLVRIIVGQINGNVVITASGVKSGESVVSVTGVEMNLRRTNLTVGGSVTLIPSIAPENATNQTVAWATSDESVAAIDENGVVTAVSEGTATITVMTVDGRHTATCAVTVTKATTPSRPSTGGNSGSTTTTETKEDGTKVTTETKPDGTKVETTETPDGTVAVVETKPDGSKTQTVEQADGTKSEMEVTKDGDVTITVTDAEGEELVKTEIPAEIPEPETKFEDVTEAAPWAEEAIDKMAGLKLVNGTGDNKYSPVAPMTRGSLATVLHRLSQGKTDYEVTFKDVAEGKYYTEGVAWAAKANVVKGISEDVFAPDKVITREQLAVMLARYAKLVGLNTKADAKTLESFTDGDTTGVWAVDGVAWCVENGILKGKGQNNLDPTADVTRAEVAVMLDRFIALLK